jgi:hypothetical protein
VLVADEADLAVLRGVEAGLEAHFVRVRLVIAAEVARAVAAARRVIAEAVATAAVAIAIAIASSK